MLCWSHWLLFSVFSVSDLFIFHFAAQEAQIEERVNIHIQLDKTKNLNSLKLAKTAVYQWRVTPWLTTEDPSPCQSVYIRIHWKFLKLIRLKSYRWGLYRKRGRCTLAWMAPEIGDYLDVHDWAFAKISKTPSSVPGNTHLSTTWNPSEWFYSWKCH